jgi:hypothetical protein
MEETQEDLTLQIKESGVPKNEKQFGTIAFPKEKMEAI